MRSAVPLTLLFAAAPAALSTSARAGAPAAQQAPASPGRQAPMLAKAPPGISWSATPAEPRELVLLARLRNPDATIAAVQGLVPVPNVRGMLMTSLGPVAAAIAPGAPLDLAVALNPDGGDQPMPPIFAVSVGVTSLEAAQRVIREQLQGELVEIQRGVYTARLFQGTSRETHCLLGPAPGAAPLRLACADKVRDVSALGSYLIRLSPVRDQGPADVHAELRVAPAYQRYGEALRGAMRLLAMTAPQKLQLGQPGFDRALTDAVQGLSAELQATVADLDRAVIDLSLGQGGIELRAAYKLRGRASWLAGVLKDEAARTATPPALFFRLPRDSRTAYWTAQGMAEERAAPLTSLLSRLLDGYLEHEGIGAADRKLVTDLFKAPWPERTVVWSGGAMDPQPGQKPDGADKGGKKPAPAGVFGTDYSLGGFEGPPDQLRAFLQGAVQAYNRPALQALLRKKLKELNVTVPAPVVKLLPPQKGLPAGSLGLQLTVTLPEGAPAAAALAEAPKGKAAKPKTVMVPTTVHLLVVPDGAQSWIGFGAHLPTVLRRLREQPKLVEEQTLARREGLEALREGRRVSGGYWTVASIAEALWRVAARGGGRPPGEMTRLLLAAPSHGETPMLFLSNTRDGATIDRELVVRLPRPSIEDIIAIVLGLATKG